MGAHEDRVRVTTAVTLAWVLGLAGSAAAAELWQWTDATGAERYTNDRETIPPAFRAGARDVGSPQPRAPAHVPPDGVATGPGQVDDAAVLPVEAGAPIRAPVSLNGVPLTLIVDTGADRTVLSPVAAARAGVDASRTREVAVVGVTGRGLAREATAERLDVAGRQLGPIVVVVAELDVPEADGLLGRDVLDHFTLTVEPGARRAVLAPR